MSNPFLNSRRFESPQRAHLTLPVISLFVALLTTILGIVWNSSARFTTIETTQAVQGKLIDDHGKLLAIIGRDNAEAQRENAKALADLTAELRFSRGVDAGRTAANEVRSQRNRAAIGQNDARLDELTYQQELFGTQQDKDRANAAKKPPARSLWNRIAGK